MNRLLTLIITTILFAASMQNAEAQIKIERSSKIVFIDNRPFYFHTVSRGETLYSIAKAYNVSEETIIEYNRFVKTGLKVRQTLKIPAEQETKPKEGKESKSRKNNDKIKQDSELSSETTKKTIENIKTDPEISAPVIAQDDEQQEVVVSQDSIVAEPEKVQRTLGETKYFNPAMPIDVTLMLPFKVGGKEQSGFVEFYQGVLIALEDMKREGISVNLNVYDTERSESTIRDILNSCKETNLIIGPAYQNEFGQVVEFADRNQIPVVSPLGSVEVMKTPLLYQASPDDKTKYLKLKQLLSSPDQNIFFIKPANGADEEFIREISPILPSSVHRIDYSQSLPTSSIAGMLDDKRDNLFIVASSNENKVEEILSRLSSINVQALGKWKMSVVGTPRWARFQNIEMSLFFKLNLRYITSYHVNRGEPVMQEFFRQYVEQFGTLPTLYSYRGYDVARLFVSSMAKYGPRFPMHMEGEKMTMLQVPYKFRQESRESKFENTEWIMLRYTPDYKILIE